MIYPRGQEVNTLPLVFLRTKKDPEGHAVSQSRCHLIRMGSLGVSVFPALLIEPHKRCKACSGERAPEYYPAAV